MWKNAGYSTKTNTKNNTNTDAECAKRRET
jgi:hypothetical protein